MKYLYTLPLLALIAAATSAFAQSSGQSARVTMGVVEKAESVTLQNTGEGALPVRWLAPPSATTRAVAKARRKSAAARSSAAPSAGRLGSSGTTPGMQYTVKFADGSSAIVVSDQVQLKVGDCVSVEEARSMTNIREQDPAACNPEVEEAITDLQDELAEDADECAQVKQELLAAKRPRKSKSQPPRPGFCVTRAAALNSRKTPNTI